MHQSIATYTVKRCLMFLDSNSYHHLQNEHIVGLSMTATETVNLSKRVDITGQRVISPSDFYRSKTFLQPEQSPPAGWKYKCSFKALPHKLRFLEQKATVCLIKMKIDGYLGDFTGLGMPSLFMLSSTLKPFQAS